MSSEIEEKARAAKAAGRALARTSAAARTEGLRAIARELRARVPDLLAANAIDVADARERGLADSFVDRLLLTPARIEAMAAAVDEIAAQDDPIGQIDRMVVRPNGLRVGRMRIPIGVVAVIYEARPNVTSDAAALALRSGNAILLKAGSDARASAAAIGGAIAAALATAGLPPAAVQVWSTGSRDELRELLALDAWIDMVIPRGGEGLIRYVAEHSRIPVIKHYKGVCHVYVHGEADLEMAQKIVANAKTSRPSVCNAAETLLVDRAVASTFVPQVADALLGLGVTLHVCETARALLGDRQGVVDATDADWEAEYLSLDLAIRVVDDMDAAIVHIERWGSDHTEAIVTRSYTASQAFINSIQSSCVMVNASTRFADGGELGLGAEIGISTSRIHAYGPMGAEGLTTQKFVVLGDGHTR